MDNPKIIINFQKTEESGDVSLSVEFLGADILQVAVASLQLKAAIVDQLGKEGTENLFSSLKLGHTDKQVRPIVQMKPTTEA